MIALSILFISIKSFSQCSCMSFAPEWTYKNVKYIFVGKITKHTKDDKESKYQIQLTESFRGMETQTSVEIYDSFYNCNSRRYEGKEYLFLVSKDEKTNKFNVIGCSYSYENIHKQKQYIEYFRMQKKSGNKGGFILGKVTAFFDNEGNSQKPDGVDKIFIEGEDGGKHEVQIEGDGFYKLGNLKAGRYKVFLSLPESLTTYGDANDFDWAKSVRYVNISNDNGALADFSVSINGIISGKIVDENGSPVSSIDVNLYNLDDKGEEFNTGMTETDYQGNYRFKGLTPGNYFIKVGTKDWYLDPTSKNAAFSLMYFPNVKNKVKGEIIKLGKAEVLKDKNMFLMSLKKRNLTGQVLMPDGLPASNIKISVQIKRENDGQKSSSGGYVLTETNSQGSFSFYAYDETSYLIEAEIWKRISDVQVEVLFSSECVVITKNGAIKPLKIFLKKGDGHCDKENFGFGKE